jgi:diadenosine tetraphosphatase ApaH/serine/threonine PP2A family protein phosphatase
MRCAVLADIHANLAAFTAVLDDIRQRGGVDELWSLGDIVDYGPEPHACIELLRRYRHRGVAGNHDLAAVGQLDINGFNPQAAVACIWTARQLEPADVDYLEQLPLTVKSGDFMLVHGSPREPVIEYLLTTGQAAASLAYLEGRYCFVGHTHRPCVFEFDNKGNGRLLDITGDKPLVPGDHRLFINPGSVGQPRDGDPRAAYAIYDTEAGKIEFYRVAYDIRETQRRMAECGLPQSLIDRLDYGR